ncbi:MAG: hypothetical protein WCL32_19100 [Planctomycetota bacterium]
MVARWEKFFETRGNALSARRPRGVRPIFETLEARDVPASIDGGASWTGWTSVGMSNQAGIYGSGSTTDVYEVYKTMFIFNSDSVSGGAVGGGPTGGTTGFGTGTFSAGAFASGNTILGIGVRRVSGSSITFTPTVRFDLGIDSYQAATTVGGSNGRTSFSTYSEFRDFTVQFEGANGWRGSTLTMQAGNGTYYGGPINQQQIVGGIGSGVSYDFPFRAFAQTGGSGSYQMFFDLNAIKSIYGASNPFGLNSNFTGIGTIGKNVGISLNGLGTNNVAFGAATPPPIADPTRCSTPCCETGPTAAPDSVIRAYTAATGGGLNLFSAKPVRYFDGVVSLGATDLAGSDGGLPWGLSRSWTNGPGYVRDDSIGVGWIQSQRPYLQLNGSSIIAVTGGTEATYFDLVSGAYQARFFNQSTLALDSANHEFVLRDPAGDVFHFNDFSSSAPSGERGRLKRIVDSGGNVISITSSAGQVSEVTRSSVVDGATVVESYVSAYLASGPNTGKLDEVTQRRKVGAGSWTTIRKVDYAYYDGSESYGNLGDLKSAAVLDPASATLDTTYYRYFVAGETGGYVHGLKYVLSPASFALAQGSLGFDPRTATNTQLASFADHYFEYDSNRRVTKEIVQGAGCSACSGGQGTYTFSYTASGNADGFNSWSVKTVETLPDGNQNIVYTNAYGEVMLKVYKDTVANQSWATFSKFDAQGRMTLSANPSAVSGYDDSYADLLHLNAGNYQYLRDDDGFISAIAYYTTTTATTTTAGGAAGYQHTVSLLHGELGAAVPQSSID